METSLARTNGDQKDAKKQRKIVRRAPMSERIVPRRARSARNKQF